MPLITTTDLANRLRITIDDDSGQLACELASGVVAGYCGQGIESAEYTELAQVSIGYRPMADFPVTHPLYDWPSQVGVVELAQRPVTDVTSVSADGVALAADEWYWDENSNRVLLEEWNVALAEVVYTAGWDPIPDDVRAVALTIASQIYSNPGGVSAETVGSYSVKFAAGGPGIESAMARILDRYRPRVSSIRQS